MAQKILKVGKRKVAQKKATGRAGARPSAVSLRSAVRTPQKIVLVGTYRAGQLAWIGKHLLYNYPVREGDKFDAAALGKVSELWLYAGTKGKRHCYEAKFVRQMTREAWLKENPTYEEKVKSRGQEEKVKVKGEGEQRNDNLLNSSGTNKAYYVFEVKPLEYGTRFDAPEVITRLADFGGRSAKIRKAIEQYEKDGKFASLAAYLPTELSQVPQSQLRVCEAAVQLDLCLSFDASNTLATDRVSPTKAMQILSLTRHSYSKLISKGVVVGHQDGDETYFLMSDLEKAKSSPEYIDIKNGIVDSRNTLNDLTGKDWIPETKSYLYQKGLGADSADAEIERMHPAPYSFQDIGHLIRFFTKRGMRVLDPFGGVGSTAKACEIDGRVCTSIELSPKWHELSIRRLEVEVGKGTSRKHSFIHGDSCEVLRGFASDSVDFVVTSPPYWGILNKQDQKVKRDRVSRNLDTKYSDDERDLGNVSDYREFLDKIVENVFLQCARVLRHKKYMAIVVSDFRDKNQFVSFHSDLIVLLNNTEIPGGGVLRLQGTKVLIQNHKSLLPYGYPFAYVENIHHQYILIFKKDS